jgi:hypothetical protein
VAKEPTAKTRCTSVAPHLKHVLLMLYCPIILKVDFSRTLVSLAVKHARCRLLAPAIGLLLLLAVLAQ